MIKMKRITSYALGVLTTVAALFLIGYVYAALYTSVDVGTASGPDLTVRYLGVNRIDFNSTNNSGAISWLAVNITEWGSGGFTQKGNITFSGSNRNLLVTYSIRGTPTLQVDLASGGISVDFGTSTAPFGSGFFTLLNGTTVRAGTIRAQANGGTVTLSDTFSGGTFSAPTLSGSVEGTPTILSAWTWSVAQTLPNIVLSSSTASRLLATDANKNITSVANLASWISGTANQVTVTDDGDGSVTLSTPQSIATTSSPQFANLLVTSGGAIKSASGGQPSWVTFTYHASAPTAVWNSSLGNSAFTLVNAGVIGWKDSGGTVQDMLYLTGGNHFTISNQAGGNFAIQTDLANGSPTNRLVITGTAATATATWSAVTQIGLVLGGNMDGTNYQLYGLTWLNSTNLRTTNLYPTVVDDIISVFGHFIPSGARDVGSTGNPWRDYFTNSGYKFVTNNSGTIASNAVRPATAYIVALYAKSTTTGDLIFEGADLNWRFTEEPNALKLLNRNDGQMFRVDETGLFYRDRDLAKENQDLKHRLDDLCAELISQGLSLKSCSGA